MTGFMRVDVPLTVISRFLNTYYGDQEFLLEKNQADDSTWVWCKMSIHHALVGFEQGWKAANEQIGETWRNNGIR